MHRAPSKPPPAGAALPEDRFAFRQLPGQAGHRLAVVLAVGGAMRGAHASGSARSGVAYSSPPPK